MDRVNKAIDEGLFYIKNTTVAMWVFLHEEM